MMLTLTVKYCPKLIQRNLTRSYAQKVSKGKVEVEGTKLYWEKHGHGPHTVLFFPGLLGSVQTNYWPVFRKMDHTKFTMIGIDPEGYGKSRPPDRDPFIEEFCLKRDARLAGDVMEQLGYQRYSVVGWSNGGITAGQLSLMRPESVISFVACNAPMKLADRSNIVMDQITDLKNWDPKHRKDLLRIYDRDYATKILKDWRYFIKREVEKPKYLADTLMSAMDIKAPILFIYGTKDAFMNPLEAVELFDMFSGEGCTLKLVRNGTHFHLDFLDEFVEHITDFLEDDYIQERATARV